MLVIEAARDANFADADELLVVFFNFVGDIAIVGSHTVRRFQAVRPQNPEAVDALEARAVREVKRGDRITEFSIAADAREISKSETAKWRIERMAVCEWMRKKREECIDGIANAGGGREFTRVVG